MAIRIKEGENITKQSVEKVIKLMNDKDNILSKKDACNILRIAYNVKRLQNIIDEHNEQKEFSKQRRKQVRNTVISKDDVATICSMYLSGEPLSEITDITFRSSSVVKRVLGQHNVPLRSAKNNYQNPIYLREDSYADDYIKGDLVYSARYGSLAIIDGKGKMYKGSIVYPIHISGEYERAAYQPAEELGDLRKLQNEFGVKAITMSKEDIIYALNKTMLAANKNKQKHGEF